jgi:hypothetical protein
MNKRHSHSSSIRIALETRMMFDGAAAVTVDVATQAPAAMAAAADTQPIAPDSTVAPSDASHTATTAADAGQPAPSDTGHPNGSDQPAHDPADALHDALTATAPLDAASARQEIFFVDSSLPDLDTLVAALPTDAEVVYLDSASDGLAQIANALQGRDNVDAIHLLTHATEGSVVVGDSR